MSAAARTASWLVALALSAACGAPAGQTSGSSEPTSWDAPAAADEEQTGRSSESGGGERASPGPESSTPADDQVAVSPVAVPPPLDASRAIALETVARARGRARRIAAVATGVAFSADGRTILFVGHDPSAGAARSIDGQPHDRLGAPVDRPGRPRAEPDLRAATPAADPPGPRVTELVVEPHPADVPARYELEQTDSTRGTRTLLATVEALAVMFHAVPGGNLFVVGVQWDRERATLFLLDGDAGTARRLHDGPGILTATTLSPDGRFAAFVLAPYHAGRAPPPTRVPTEPAREGVRMPACDPVGSPCGEPGMCGYVPDHCGGYFDCGPCPNELPPPPGPRHGLFVVPLGV